MSMHAKRSNKTLDMVLQLEHKLNSVKLNWPIGIDLIIFECIAENEG